MPIDVKQRALRYRARGLKIVPMHTIRDGECTCSKGKTCERPGKHPITEHGVNDATTSRTQIEKWWTGYPNANIGIATGTHSDLLVLDIDPRNEGSKTLTSLERELVPLPTTVTALTGGGGRHLVFKHPPFPVRKDTGGKVFGPGVDVLSDGCIMVAPPSRHASGRRYRWEEGRSFRDLEPAPLPQAWLKRLRESGTAKSVSDTAPAQTEGLVREGRRNNHLTSLAGALRRGGTSPEALKAALAAENVAICSPPLGTAEIDKIVASVSRYAACWTAAWRGCGRCGKFNAGRARAALPWRQASDPQRRGSVLAL